MLKNHGMSEPFEIEVGERALAHASRLVREKLEQLPVMKVSVANSYHYEAKPMVKLACGSTYQGQWLKKKNTIQGKGLMIYADGSIYEGLFLNNLPHGMGRRILSD